MSEQQVEEKIDEQGGEQAPVRVVGEEPDRSKGTSRPITVVGNPVLHHPCATVTDFGPELSALVDDLFVSMYAAEGVGLAANQIGVAQRVFVYDCPDDDGVRHIGAVVNPVLDELDPAERVLDESPEGCLSVPGAYADLARPDYAVVRGQDRQGADIVVEGTGFFARCLQHETDHLNGYLYIDRLSKRDRKDALRQMAELTPRYETVPND
ncbi:peptide deformylase [Streptacidiphilus sp. P02-A3a]|uniref:peptide deformylase n=1 Tax=Streptacidiphilus sp. P02-A3a TaxID=2704468 RepID=UPI0015FB29C8|nr:peptide deformylase [Streptacidiphilus sp. P02-A3a]QMU67789.1 peptide deformylase [Streptacidiphilus sp. P02-A3a]